ncbi:MAG: hypothetical protein IPN34_03670 [Planctomycetes bacterium]|nr:hypothetical protein [Planctomycetota bacterium]
MRLLGQAPLAALLALSASCTSPTLALRDLQAIHELEESAAKEPEGESARLADASRVRYRSSAPLHGNFDRLIFESGAPQVLPELETWVAAEEEEIDEPELLSVELLIELESVDPTDTVVVCRALALLGAYLLHDPAPLARRRCAAIFGRLAGALPYSESSQALEGSAADLRFAAIVRQIRRDLGERLLAEKEGLEIDDAMLARHREPLVELRAVHSTQRDVEMRLLAVLAELLETDAPELLRVELERSCRALAGGLARRQLAFALERRDADEWVRSELATAWVSVRGAEGLEELLRWCGSDDSEAMRRTLIALLGTQPLLALRQSGGLLWLAARADDDARISSQDAARALRLATGLQMQAGEGWVEALAPSSGS